MEPSRRIKVQWREGEFHVRVKDNYTVADLKNLIFNRTSVRPEDQQLENLISHAGKVDQTTTIKELNIDEAFVLTLTIVDHPTTSAEYLDIADLTECEKGLTLDDYHTFAPNYETAPLPRPGKHLLVLDIDMTIYDPTSIGGSADRRSTRPHLHTFLKTVYQYYDILIWSFTPPESISAKLQTMAIVANSQLYKIFLCVGLPKRSDLPIKKTKSLRPIWMTFPQYSSKNSIICDDLPIHFIANPRNGVLVSAYNHKKHEADSELILLGTYLQHLAVLPDVSAVDHSGWRESVSH